MGPGGRFAAARLHLFYKTGVRGGGGAIPGGNTPAEFARLIDAEITKWAGVVKASGAKVD